MALSITSNDLSILDDEPRVQDLRLAEALGFERPRKIRELITRNEPELSRYGSLLGAQAPRRGAQEPEVCGTVPQNTDPKGRGRPGLEYWLNEAQALLICMFSRTDQAARVRRELVEVFMAWRRGRALPAGGLPPVAFPAGEEAIALLQAKLALLREARMTHGPRAAARLWPALGLPAVHESMIVEADDGRACLRTLLASAMSEDDPTSMFTLGRFLASALDGDEQDAGELGRRGLRVCGEGPGRGVVVANFTPFLASVFRDTNWRKGGWRGALRRLAGSQPHGAQRFGHATQRGTFIPEALIDELSPPAV